MNYKKKMHFLCVSRNWYFPNEAGDLISRPNRKRSTRIETWTTRDLDGQGLGTWFALKEAQTLKLALLAGEASCANFSNLSNPLWRTQSLHPRTQISPPAPASLASRHGVRFFPFHFGALKLWQSWFEGPRARGAKVCCILGIGVASEPLNVDGVGIFVRVQEDTWYGSGA